MENLKLKCINLLKEKHSQAVKTDSDAELIFEEIIDFVKKENIENFIKQNLCIFSEEEYAFDWFYNNEEYDLFTITGGKARYFNVERFTFLKDLPINIDSSMVEKSMGNVVIEELLNSHENYIKVNDNLHLTYWM